MVVIIVCFAGKKMISSQNSEIQKINPCNIPITYHIVFVPKYRYRILTEVIKEVLGKDIKSICEWSGVEIEEMNIQQDHVHMVVSIPPKILISEVMGILKGKAAIKLFQIFPKLKQKVHWENHFWARGYFVNTVGINEDLIKRYVKYQEKQERMEEKHQKEYGLFQSQQ